MIEEARLLILDDLLDPGFKIFDARDWLDRDIEDVVRYDLLEPAFEMTRDNQRDLARSILRSSAPQLALTVRDNRDDALRRETPLCRTALLLDCRESLCNLAEELLIPPRGSSVVVPTVKKCVVKTKIVGIVSERMRHVNAGESAVADRSHLNGTPR